jgi:hypothetical protein
MYKRHTWYESVTCISFTPINADWFKYCVDVVQTLILTGNGPTLEIRLSCGVIVPEESAQIMVDPKELIRAGQINLFFKVTS